MANEITLGYRSGATLTYGVYQPDGTVRTAAGTSLTEVGSTGYYKATDASILAGDIVIAKEGTTVVAYGEYLPEVSASEISDDIADLSLDIAGVDTKVDLAITELQRVNQVVPLPDPIETKARIYL